jgi:hypothetical protein
MITINQRAGVLTTSGVPQLRVGFGSKQELNRIPIRQHDFQNVLASEETIYDTPGVEGAQDCVTNDETSPNSVVGNDRGLSKLLLRGCLKCELSVILMPSYA